MASTRPASDRATASDALDVLLVVETQGADASVDVDVRMDARCTVGDLADRLAERLGAPRHGDRTLAMRGGTPAARDTPVGRLGLSHGDAVVVTSVDAEAPTAVREPPPASHELRVVGGPRAGRRFPLQRGTSVIGRSPAADIALDDPSLSGRHLQLTISGNVARVADLASRNGTQVDGRALAADESHVLRPGDVLRAGRTLLTCSPVAARGRSRSAVRGAGNGLILFNRPPRVVAGRNADRIRLAAPPDDPQKVRIPLAASLAPLAVGVLLFAVTREPTLLLFTLLTPIMAVWTFAEDRWSSSGRLKRGLSTFQEQLDAAKNSVDAAREDEVATRRRAAPDAVTLRERAVDRDERLWERRPADDDFLLLRVGTADQIADLAVELGGGGRDDLRERAQQVLDRHRVMADAPVTLPLSSAGVAGVAGTTSQIEALGRWLVIQSAVLHSPRDLAIAAAVGADITAWDWLKWLPHVRDDLPGLERHRVAAGQVASRELLKALTALLAARRADARELLASARHDRQVLLLLHEDAISERAAVVDLLAHGADHGIHIIWLGRSQRHLPGECAAVVAHAKDAPSATLTDAPTGTSLDDITLDGLDADLARSIALALAPLRDQGGVSGTGVVPRRVPLLPLLELEPLSADAVATRWGAHRGSLAAPLGIGADGPVSIDLRRDGPHGLVAGTTGAGKSELLQTMVAGLAASASPEDLTFLLIDYKGGAAFKSCVELPHTVGFVTDLDDHLAQRALISLNAELRRREGILREAGARDLIELSQRHAAVALPALVIVIDEFATLAREVPAFVDGVVDVAQRGRSLGVHLILATQRPSGVVSESVRANTNLRIALRTAARTESEDVVGVGDAARIPRSLPGRAYVRTGHSELTEMQAAYGNDRDIGPTPDDRPIVVSPFTVGNPVVEPTPSTGAPETVSDLERLIGAVNAAAVAAAVPRPQRPWLDPMPAVVTFDRLEGAPLDAGDASRRAVVGLADEPELQRQRAFTHDFADDGSLLVFGASGSGKTALLRSLVSGMAERSTVDELHVYAMDFATRGLAPIEALPHCAAVVLGEDHERITRLFALLRRTIERRRTAFAAAGAHDLVEFRRLHPREAARMVVLLDGYAGFAAAFEKVDLGALVDALPRLVADGRAFGVHFVITADRRAGIPGALTGIVRSKVVLRMADADDFASLGVDAKAVGGAVLPAGRGFVPPSLELQVALLGPDPSGAAQDAALDALARRLRSGQGARRAPPLARMPTAVRAAELPVGATGLQPVLGVEEEELSAVGIDLREAHFLVTGPYRSGRSTALQTLVRSIRAADQAIGIHLVAPRRSPLVDADGFTTSARGPDACAESIAALTTRTEVGGDLHDVPLLVVVDDGDEMAEGPVSQALERLVRRGRDGALRVLASGETHGVLRAYGGWLREMRKEENALLLNPSVDVDGDLVGVRLPRRTNAVFPPGRGYLVERGEMRLVQVASSRER